MEEGGKKIVWRENNTTFNQKIKMQAKTDVVLVSSPFRKYPKLIFDSTEGETSKLLHVMGTNLDSTAKVKLDRLPPEEHHLTYSAI